ncbi:uncharacterized protein C8R40DRAFT_1264085 [Lentinula edodes]|uniref:uncharacterized protein n=1 Tax=Lentinula edodes TaxID=5353 RepID=UPI001E8CDA40|nr:uncharacterized protein C8R40DRAFT_1264085 [Lentinula edodes]KAH7877269.1 hypothetical protein C8R40DRAFT_1264085 [Lentinula edodes]
MSSTNIFTKPYNLSNYYAALALGYNEITLYQEAEAITTRALQLSPTSYRARYNRAIARWKMDDLRGAVADIDILIISGGKNFPGVAQTHKTLHKLFELDDDNKTFNNGTRGARQARLARESKDLSWPQPDLAPVEPSKDDHRPSDEIAPGQYRHGRPCRLHNLKTCMHADCSFSHTPDNNSIRDIDGRNVCLNFLLGCCTRNKRCSYRHSIDGLSEDVTTKPSLDSTFTLQLQWWNDPARIQEVRDLMEARNTRRKLEYNIRAENATEGAVEAGSLQTKKKENVLPDAQMQITNRKNKQFYPKRRTTSDEKSSAIKKSSTMSSSKLQSIGSNTKEKERKKHNARVAKRAAKRDQTEESAAPDRKKTSTTRTYYPESKTVKSLEKLANCGFTNDEVVDLMEFGVNPWDEDAHSVFAHVDDY